MAITYKTVIKKAIEGFNSIQNSLSEIDGLGVDKLVIDEENNNVQGAITPEMMVDKIKNLSYIVDNEGNPITGNVKFANEETLRGNLEFTEDADIVFKESVYVPSGTKLDMFETEENETGMTAIIGYFANIKDEEITPDQPEETIFYEVIFELNYETENRTYITVQIEENDSVGRPEQDPVRDGYTFTGWFLDPECTTEWTFDVNTITEETHIYAGWAEISE